MIPSLKPDPLARAHEAIDDAVHEGYSDGVSGTSHRHDASKEAHAALEEVACSEYRRGRRDRILATSFAKKGAPDAS